MTCYDIRDASAIAKTSLRLGYRHNLAATLNFQSCLLEYHQAKFTLVYWERGVILTAVSVCHPILSGIYSDFSKPSLGRNVLITPIQPKCRHPRLLQDQARKVRECQSTGQHDRS